MDYAVLKIPKSSLGYKTNNNYPKFPPLMSDGRSLVSNWQPETIANHQLIVNNQLSTNWSYRKFLTENANDIMKTNFVQTANDTGYMIPPSDVFRDHATPFLAQYKDSVSPFAPNQISDLQQNYLRSTEFR